MTGLKADSFIWDCWCLVLSAKYRTWHVGLLWRWDRRPLLARPFDVCSYPENEVYGERREGNGQKLLINDLRLDRATR